MSVDMSRVTNAGKLADYFDNQNLTSEDLFSLGEKEWVIASGCCEVEFPDSATKALVVHRLMTREQLAGSDPLSGLPGA